MQEKSKIVVDPNLSLFSVSIENPSYGAVDAMLVWARDMYHARIVASRYERIPGSDRIKWETATCVSMCSPIEEVLVAYNTSDLPENQDIDDETWVDSDELESSESLSASYAQEFKTEQS